VAEPLLDCTLVLASGARHDPELLEKVLGDDEHRRLVGLVGITEDPAATITEIQQL